MSRKLSQSEFDEISTLVERITGAYSQKEAAKDISRLEFLSNVLDVASNISYMLSELTGYSKDASKRKDYSEKEHWQRAAKSKLYVLSSFVEREDNENE